MGFPNIIYGRYGDEKVSSSAKQNGWELGQRMILPDGREFVYARCDTATALSTGVLTNMPAPTDADLVLSTTGTAAVGATTVVISLGATAGVAANELQDGYILHYRTGTTGYMYRIKSNNSAAASGTTNVTLHPYDETQVAIAGSVLISRNPFERLIVKPASTQSNGIPAGVTANSVAAGRYFWAQRRGVCQILTSDTVGLVGEPCVSSTVTAGAVCRNVIDADTTTTGDWKIGRFLTAVGTAADYALVYIDLEKCR